MVEMLQHPFFRYALIAGMLAAGMCAMVGVYVLLKRIVFVGVTLAQLSSAGVALALLLQIPPLVLALSVVVELVTSNQGLNYTTPAQLLDRAPEILRHVDNALVIDDVFRREIANNVWHLMPAHGDGEHRVPSRRCCQRGWSRS